jgi:hypothetical protein
MTSDSVAYLQHVVIRAILAVGSAGRWKSRPFTQRGLWITSPASVNKATERALVTDRRED